MKRRSKVNDWAWIGSGCIFYSIVNFIALMVRGSGVGGRFGHDPKGMPAVLLSVVFFFLGLLLLLIWALLRFAPGGGSRR